MATGINSFPKPHKTRPPLRTLNELADELGLKSGQLRMHLIDSPVKPPNYVHQLSGDQGKGSHRTYYVRKEILTWWAAHLEAQKAAT